MRPTPTAQDITDAYRNGRITLRFDCFKESGKWYSGAWVYIPEIELLAVRWDRDLFIELIDRYQTEIVRGHLNNYHLFVSDMTMQDVLGYNHFLTRLFVVYSS